MSRCAHGVGIAPISAPMMTDSACAATLPGQPASLACTVNVDVAAVVGVPLIVPFAASDRPDGSAPATIDQLVVPVPPAAVSAAEYAALTLPDASVAVVTVIGVGAITIVAAADATRPFH